MDEIYKQKAEKYKYKYLKLKQELEGGSGILWKSRPKDLQSLIEQANSKPMIKEGQLLTPVTCALGTNFDVKQFISDFKIEPHESFKNVNDITFKDINGVYASRYFKMILNKKNYDKLNLDFDSLLENLGTGKEIIYAGKIINNEKNRENILKYFVTCDKFNINTEDEYYGFIVKYINVDISKPSKELQITPNKEIG